MLRGELRRVFCPALPTDVPLRSIPTVVLTQMSAYLFTGKSPLILSAVLTPHEKRWRSVEKAIALIRHQDIR